MTKGIDRRIADAFEAENGFALQPHLIVLGLMGSHSHGTYIPPEEPEIDDVDLMGFLVPPLQYHIGLPRWEHWRLQVDELDVVIYSLDKAVRLLLKSNPNIVGFAQNIPNAASMCYDSGANQLVIPMNPNNGLAFVVLAP
ncbi:MAG TPA: nucleotidyltransferase domain-containing protein [Gemmatimonadales bacterium]|nr:nucleotidyltransferase domain-containing protein [Gemmatimonadales bacterium]